ncbi:MAG: BatA domain-containing protein [Planctomyces sp.]
MTFLQSWILYAIPLTLLPIVIHLINQNRHKTVQWAATMFLLQAKRMVRGMARLRYVLILIARMLAIAGLLLALSRPMSGGWLGLAGGGPPELTVIILDRSASMELQDPQSGLSRRETALQKVSGLFRDLGSKSRTVLFDTATGRRVDLTDATSLAELAETSPTATAADLSSIVQAAAEFIATSEAGRTDVWICSDLQRSGWQPTSGRWNDVRQQLSQRQGLRMDLLLDGDDGPENFAVQVSQVQRRETEAGAELLMDIDVQQTSGVISQQARRIPLSLVINGARSTFEVEVSAGSAALSGHAMPVDREAIRGWGRLELPRDGNPQDNVWNFVYAEPPVQKTVIVSDDEASARLLRRAAAVPSERGVAAEAAVVPVSAAETIDLQTTALILGQAEVPAGEILQQLQAWVKRGGALICFPPPPPSTAAAFGLSWSGWTAPEQGERFAISGWRTDSGLLANTRSGAPLPVGQIPVFQACGIAGEPAAELAGLGNGMPLLVRAQVDSGSVWFCATLPGPQHSGFASNGIVFYVLVQRALAAGLQGQGHARQYNCGNSEPAAAADWVALDPDAAPVLSVNRPLVPGVWQLQDRLLALNRPLQDDAVERLREEELQQTLSGLTFTVIRDSAGSADSLAAEVWRAFLLLMIAALMAEALLCLPQPATVSVAARGLGK